MTPYKQGDVLLVPFPFTDQSTSKQRPAIVLTTESYNRNHLDIILAPVTSQISKNKDDILLLDWKSAGLLKSSSVKPVLSSFETSLVRRKLGVLSQDDLKKVRQLFQRILGL